MNKIDTDNVNMNNTNNVIMNNTNNVIMNNTDNVNINNTNNVNMNNTSNVNMNNTSNVTMNNTNNVNIHNTGNVIIHNTDNVNMNNTDNVNMDKIDIDYIDDFRRSSRISALAALILREVGRLVNIMPKNIMPINIMEVCGGHTHTIMRFGLMQILPPEINFVHGPGCPVCIMPKERVDHAVALARDPGNILVTFGDMIRVPGSGGSLRDVRARGGDVRPVYSPLDALSVARENPRKRVVYFAIGFETTAPTTAALIMRAEAEGLKNLFFHINHVLVVPPVSAIMEGGANIDAFIGPSHVSVITGARVYDEIAARFGTPVVVAGFEPVDVMDGVLRVIRQIEEIKRGGAARVEIQYTRAVTIEGNARAAALVEKYFQVRDSFRWRGLGDIPQSALRLRPRYASMDAEEIFKDTLPCRPIDDHKRCICGSILRGAAKPPECPVFGSACTPENPLGACMVSSEGACAAYHKYMLPEDELEREPGLKIGNEIGGEIAGKSGPQMSPGRESSP